MKAYLNILKNNQKTIITLCDANIFNNKYKENNFVIDTHEPYFGGQLIEIESFDTTLLKENIIFHVVGKESVNYFKTLKIINDKNISKIADVPYFMIFFDKQNQNNQK